MSTLAQKQKIRRIVWTGAIASVTATGVWYGAGLKIQREQKQVSIPSLFAYLINISLTSIGRSLKKDVKQQQQRRLQNLRNKGAA